MLHKSEWQLIYDDHPSKSQPLLQENRLLATKPFRHTKVSISSLDVPGDEIVHQATKIVSSTNVGSRIVLATKYFCRLIVSTFSNECFRRLNIIWRRIYFCCQKLICRRNIILRPKIYRRRNLVLQLNNIQVTNLFLSPKVDLSTKHNSSPKNLQATKLSFVAK